MSAASTLHGDELQLRYGKTMVVHGVSVALHAGRVTAFVGPNGSGKSTLLRALARLHHVDSGEVLLSTAGEQPRSVSLLKPREFAREVTLFAQTHSAPEGLTVAEIVAFGRHPYRRGFSASTVVDRRAIDHALQVTGLQDKRQRAVGELSGGEMQRVWLAACLAQDTGVVLLDEPTNHLDLRYQVETLDLVRDLADEHGAAVGVVLHDLEQAAEIADTLLLLHAGHVHACGSPGEVLTAANIEEVYGIPVDVGTDARTGRLHIDPVMRHQSFREEHREEHREDPK